MPNGTIGRRDFLSASAALAVGVHSAEAAPENAGWIDAHSHIWPAETDRFPLAEGLSKKDLDPPSFTDDELLALARPEGVERVVLIQHSIFHRFDNSYLVDAVKRRPQLFRVVGMVDDLSPAPGEQMERLLPQGVTGFRITPFIRKNHPERWLENDGMRDMWKTGAKTRQAMCCLINPSDLPAVATMCERHPETPVVIDHFARIGADGKMRDEDVRALCDLSRHKSVHVKVSAFYALGEKKPPHLELIPMIKRLIESFGTERLMWASDAPYQVQGVNTYRDSIRLIRDRLDFVTDRERTQLLRTTAERVFFFA